MLVNRLIPVLLLEDEGLFKTTKFKNPTYVGDPRNAVKIFNEKQVDELCLLDIGATKGKKGPDFDFIRELSSECFMPVSYGGGITKLDQVKTLFSLGIEKVILNTVLFNNEGIIKEIADVFGSQSVVASIDLKKNFFGKYELRSNNGTKKEKDNPIDFVKRLVNLGAGEIIINSIDRDGTRSGLDLELISTISEHLDIPVIACGGVGELEHIREGIIKGGASAIAAGSFFVFHGKHRAVLITYPAQKEIRRILKL